MDVVNEYLYKKTKKKRDISLAEKSIESSIQLNAQLNSKFNINNALRNHQHRSETENDLYNRSRLSPQSNSPPPMVDGIPQTKLPLINSTRQIFQVSFLNA